MQRYFVWDCQSAVVSVICARQDISDNVLRAGNLTSDLCFHEFYVSTCNPLPFFNVHIMYFLPGSESTENSLCTACDDCRGPGLKGMSGDPADGLSRFRFCRLSG
ncbi:hypothetical protein DPEC_G00252640 [Dallia pectoralis]|uniref:Uncharacterized protein n=1 Tax=Dallia pectoralis TaxID=75939 RepID=A0ACC2FTU1_DALPE|nr:hypothetical protein DPEC_G00252640 [Dallia pectoralis]